MQSVEAAARPKDQQVCAGKVGRGGGLKKPPDPHENNPRDMMLEYVDPIRPKTPHPGIRKPINLGKGLLSSMENTRGLAWHHIATASPHTFPEIQLPLELIYVYIYIYIPIYIFLYRNVKFSRLNIFSWGKSIYFFEKARIESHEPETYFLANFTDKKSLSVLACRPVSAAPNDSIN